MRQKNVESANGIHLTLNSFWVMRKIPIFLRHIDEPTNQSIFYDVHSHGHTKCDISKSILCVLWIYNLIRCASIHNYWACNKVLANGTSTPANFCCKLEFKIRTKNSHLHLWCSHRQKLCCTLIISQNTKTLQNKTKMIFFLDSDQKNNMESMTWTKKGEWTNTNTKEPKNTEKKKEDEGNV